MRVCDAVAVSPLWPFEGVTAMIETILGARCAVQVDDDLQASRTSPSDRLVQIWCGTRNIFPLDLEKRPIPDGNADNVETGVLDFPEILELHKAVPVGLEGLAAFRLADLLTERPLITDVPAITRVLPEYRGCDEAETISDAKMISLDVITYGSSTSQPPMFTPRTLSVVELQSQATPRSSGDLVYR